MKSILIDFEALGYTSTSKVVSLSAIIFDHSELYSFDDLSRLNTFDIEFDLSKGSQDFRTTDDAVLNWWKSQPPVVTNVLLSTDNKVSLDYGVRLFEDFCNKNEIGKHDLIYSRGTSYDLPILADLISKHGSLDAQSKGYSMYPCTYWNQRDTRTALAYMYNSPGLRRFPVDKNLMNGFIKHNSLHDCLKDIILLQFNSRIFNDELEFKEEDIIYI